LGGRYVISDSLGLSPRGEAHAISDFVKSKPDPKAYLWAFPLRFMADTTSPSRSENSLSNSSHSRLFFLVMVEDALHLLPDHSGTLFPLLW